MAWPLIRSRTVQSFHRPLFPRKGGGAVELLQSPYETVPCRKQPCDDPGYVVFARVNPRKQHLTYSRSCPLPGSPRAGNYGAFSILSTRAFPCHGRADLVQSESSHQLFQWRVGHPGGRPTQCVDCPLELASATHGDGVPLPRISEFIGASVKPNLGLEVHVVPESVLVTPVQSSPESSSGLIGSRLLLLRGLSATFSSVVESCVDTTLPTLVWLSSILAHMARQVTRSSGYRRCMYLKDSA